MIRVMWAKEFRIDCMSFALVILFGACGEVKGTPPPSGSFTVVFDTRSPNGATVDADGKILLVGVTGGKPSVARLDVTGMPDSTFKTNNGVAAIDFGVAGSTVQTGGYGISLDADGRIVFAGEVGPAGGQNMAVGRLWF